jgi:catechol 2,3-dioxygenase-like lactoylglutathione lyase family enzyme
MASSDYRLELINVPVSDVDRSIDFYVNKVGFSLDHDHTPTDEIRFVQLTPKGSPASISIGTGLPNTEPGSVKGLQLVVDDIDAARAELTERGVEVSEIDELPWGRFAYFADPDGNGWVLQLNSRLS